jgi:putative aldouronate transport system substrate-binding protein
VKEVTPALYALYDEQIWNATKVKGRSFMVPNYNPGVSFPGFWPIVELCDKYGFDPMNTHAWEDWESYFDKILAGEEGVVPLLSDEDYWGRLWFPNYYGYIDIGSVKAPHGQPLVVMKWDDKARKVIAAPWTEEYKAAVTLARKWYEKGYMMKTPPAEAQMFTLRSAKMFAAFAVPFVGVWDTAAMAANEWGGATIAQARILGKPNIVTTGTLISSGNTVTKMCKHPELALKFIELMHTDEKIHNLLNYGVENVHWVWQDEAKRLITYPAGVTAETVGWNPNAYYQFGSKKLQYFNSEGALEESARLAEADKDTVYSTAVGFTPDPEPVKAQIAAVASVAQEYAEVLERGLVSPDDASLGLEAMKQRLQEAGIDEIVAEFQRQVDQWAVDTGL